MANTNMISSNNNSSSSGYGNSYSNNLHNHNISVGGDSGNCSGSNGGAATEVQTLRDVCNMLNAATAGQNSNFITIPTGGCAYDHILALMSDLNLQDDGILLNNKIKRIEADFCNIVRDESMLCESMEYMNDKALGDGDTALKFALLFSSRNFDALAMKETKVRSAMLKILETNFINADAYREHDRERLYNSITLLGEYYHRVRLADNTPITILGESLLNLLTREINDVEARTINTRLARLILSQITLNGEIMRKRHKTEIDQLLYHIRRHLIIQPSLTPKVKAMLLMVLDLFYSHFKHVGIDLEAMYTDYLVSDDIEEECINYNKNEPIYTQQPAGQDVLYAEAHGVNNIESASNAANSAQDSFELQPTTKKWSEQVCEDSMCDTVFNDPEIAASENLNSIPRKEAETQGHQIRNTHQQQNSSRSLKLQPTQPVSEQFANNPTSTEDRDESKPLPSWRKTRFNRPNDTEQHNGRSRNQQRRFSASFDDDHHSVRSDGGNFRLYSIHDRRKHSQERYERNLSNNYNSIVNSNWDQRDDRSERSYMSNYERGNYKRGGRFNNRNSYDKPPRFQKQQQAHSPNGHKKIHSETWRRSNSGINNAYQDENYAYNSNVPDQNSRNSSRAHTLPRPPKSQMDDGNRKSSVNSSYRYSQSPTAHGGNGSGGGTRNLNSRYSSQSSLASEASSSFDRRQPPVHHHQRHRNFTRRSQPNIHQPSAENWQGDNNRSGANKDESELVRNAQQTTKYMNYLSSQK